MACLSNYTLTGIAGSCEANLAGIQKAWLGYKDDFDFDVTYTEGTSAYTIGVSAATTGTAKPVLNEYVFNRQTGGYTSELTKDETNGTNYYVNTLTLVFSRMESQKHLEIEALAKEHLIGIVLDNNGVYHLFGADGYLSLDTDTTGTGVSYDDANSYQLSLSAMSKWKALIIDKTKFNEIMNLVEGE